MLNNSPRTMNGMYDLTHTEDSAREGGLFHKAKRPIPLIQADEDEYMDDFKAYEDFMSNDESGDSEGGAREGGFIKDATTIDTNSTGVADTVKKGVDAIGVGKIPFVGGAAKFIAGDVVGGLADDAVNVVGHGTAAAADAIKGDTSSAAGQLKSAAMPAFNLGLTAATAGAGGALAKGGAKAAGAAMAKTAAKEPLTLVQAGMSGLQDIQDRNINKNNLQDNLN